MLLYLSASSVCSTVHIFYLLSLSTLVLFHPVYETAGSQQVFPVQQVDISAYRCTDATECRHCTIYRHGLVINIPASHSEGPLFKLCHGDRSV